jgi:biopolymer transport protein ExbB/TolQ
VGTLGATTMSAGLLGTTVGIVKSFSALPKAPPTADRLVLGARGCAESLHNLVLALMVVTLCGLIASVGSLRGAFGGGPRAQAR